MALMNTVYTGNASYTWKAIEFDLELVKKVIIWRIGDGANVWDRGYLVVHHGGFIPFFSKTKAPRTVARLLVPEKMLRRVAALMLCM